MTRVFDLRPEGNLLNKNFEKYQYTNENTPQVREIPLETEAFRKSPSPGQDSYLEMALLTMHNNLHTNPFDESCWFFDSNGAVWKTSKENDLTLVYQLGGNLKDYRVFNPSVAFTAMNILAICDGNATVHVVNVSGAGNVECLLQFQTEAAGIILDTRYVAAKSLLVIALCSAERVDKKMHLQVTLYTYRCEQQGKSMKIIDRTRTQKFRVAGPIEYLYIEESGEFLHVISEHAVKCILDTLKPLEKDVARELKIPRYSWSQDKESLSVWVKIPAHLAELKAQVQVAPTKVVVTIGDCVLIQGETPHRLQSDLATWSQNKDLLEIDLPKWESGQMWAELMKGDSDGECLPNQALAADIHSRLAHMCSDQMESDDSAATNQPLVGFNSDQLEECDVQGNENLLQRIDLNSHECTHSSFLGSTNRVLFNCKYKDCQAVCLRYDHDGCLWFLGSGSMETTWDYVHKYTFPGLGYIEASKVNKQFCISPSDASYVAILECNSYIHIYDRPANDTVVGNQRVFDHHWDHSMTIGAAAIGKFLYVLTKNKLYSLQVVP